MPELGLADKLVAIDVALAKGSIPHAFGGAIALAYYAEPRATIDIDCNVFVNPEAHAEVTHALEPLGFDAAIDPVRVKSDGQVRIKWGATPIDLFFAYDPVHDAMADGIRRVDFGDTTIPILGPEHLVVCKVVFDRAKDWLDIEQVLVAVEAFDVDTVRRWVRRVAGAGDQRARRFDEIAARLLGR